MSRTRIAALMIQDPGVAQAMRSTFGSDDASTLVDVLRATRAETIAKGMAAMVAAPKSAKKLVAIPKPPPVPKPPTAATAPSAPPVQGAVKPIAPTIAKADEGDEDYEFGFDVEITKFDTDERTVFGWASITEQDGVPVLDRQGDMIATEEMAKAAYDYVVASRKGGHQHKRTETDEPLQVSDMIESMMFTPEKIAKMGLPADTPVGWWCGFRVSDDEVWKAVKDGEIQGFSVHGKGRRTPA